MSQPSKRQNFLQGAALLAMAVAIVKVIGAIYKIPLKLIIGDVGFSYFNTAYDIYTLLLTISTAGLPIAMSRMISQAHSLGQFNREKQIYRAARTIYLILGLIATLVMGIFCQALADTIGQPGAWAAILCLAPCALLMGFISSYRGFFQGQSNMRPTSTSQVVEAACKLVVGLSAAYIVYRLTANITWSAAGAILGVTVGCLISALYLRGQFAPAYQALETSAEEVESFRSTAGQLISIALPITVGSAGLQLLNVLEIGIYMDRIEGLLSSGQYRGNIIAVLEAEVQALQDYSPDKQYSLMASSLKGVYNFCYTIFNMPCSFILPINTSVLPAITAFLTLGDHKGVRSTEASAARITGLLCTPCAIGLAVLAQPVMALLGNYQGEKLVLAGQLMTVMGIGVFFYSITMFTNGLLQSHGKMYVPVVNTLSCGVAKMIALYFLTGNPAIGILGVPICSVLCYAGISLLNLIWLHFTVPEKTNLVQNILRALPAGLLMGAAVYGVQWLMSAKLGITSNVLLCGGPILVGVAVYVVLAVATKAITKEDCLLLPKGDKIAKLLKL